MEENFDQSKHFQEQLDRIESQNREMLDVLHFLRRAVFYSRIWVTIKILILLIPILLGILYLPPLIRSAFDILPNKPSEFDISDEPDLESLFE